MRLRREACPGPWYGGLQMCEHINGSYPAAEGMLERWQQMLQKIKPMRFMWWCKIVKLSRFVAPSVSLTGLGHSLIAGAAALSLGRGAADECELLLADAEPAAEDGSRRSEEQYDEQSDRL